MVRVEAISEVVSEHGEGPAWSPRWTGPRFVDMLRGEILELGSDGTVARRRGPDGVAAAVRARRGGGWLVATERAVWCAEQDALDAPMTELVEIWSDPEVRGNEGACDPAGAFYLGSMAWDASPGRGELVRVDPTGTTEVVVPSVTISNGLAWSPDTRSAYYVDTATGTIDVFDWDPRNGLRSRRPWVHVEGGGADGLTVDAEGGVWVAVFGQGAVHHYDADGRLVQVVPVPVSQPTAVAFVGPELDRLIVTTSRYGLDEPEPEAGALLEITGHGTTGLQMLEFGG